MKLPPKARRRIYAKHSKPHLSKLKQLTAPPQKDPLVQRTILVPYADRDKPHAAIVTHAKPPIETEPNTPVYAAHRMGTALRGLPPSMFCSLTWGGC
jgi:hypothetical protein